jgi:hypothetical protein
MNMPSTNRDQSMLWGYPLEFWDWLGIRLMFGGALIGVLALFLSLISAYVLYRVADIAQSELQSKTSTLGVEISSARERAATLEKEAADARSETERLKQVVAWRIISPENASKLEKLLALKPGSVNVRYTDGDPEALYLAMQLIDILKKAKWHAALGAWKFSDTLVFGCRIPNPATRQTKILRAAFTDANIEFSTEDMPSGGLGLLVGVIPDAPILMVGSREPTQF